MVEHQIALDARHVKNEDDDKSILKYLSCKVIYVEYWMGLNMSNLLCHTGITSIEVKLREYNMFLY